MQQRSKIEALYLIVNSMALLALVVYFGARLLGVELPAAALPLLILIEAANIVIAVCRILYSRKMEKQEKEKTN